MDEHIDPGTLSSEHIEALVLMLYQPNPPDVISATQATLTQLQGSPRAWSVARDLLSRPDEKVKFHGALIIIIKLNNESSALSKRDAEELLLNLIGWYIESINRTNSPLVTRKLASALATYFIHFPSLWPRYILHLTNCLVANHPFHPTSLPDTEELGSLILHIDPNKLQALLWVTANVMEDVTKLDLDSVKNAELYDVLRFNTPQAAGLLSEAISVTHGPQIYETSMKCLQSWIWLAQKVSSKDRHFIEALRPLMTVTIRSLYSDVPVDVTMELITDVLTNFSSLLSEDQCNMLTEVLSSDWSQARYQSLLQGDPDPEAFQFCQLLLGFVEARLENILRNNNGQETNLLESISGLLSAEGYPAVDDKIFVPTLEFWSSYVETLTDEMYSADVTPGEWKGPAVSFALQAVSAAWKRIAFPPQEELNQWDINDRAGFAEARKEVADLLQSTYALTGPQLSFTFAELVVSALQEASWANLEAAAFCLGSLSDCTREDSRCDGALYLVFSSPLFITIQAQRPEMSARARQTCVSLIEQYTEYFERNTVLLPSALNMLFTLVGEHSLASPVSKSISRLCSSCRHHLSPEIWAFLDEYEKLRTSSTVDCICNEKILGGVACVAQGVPDKSSGLIALERMLAFIEKDHKRTLELVHSRAPLFPCSHNWKCMDDAENENPAIHMGLRVLRSLVAVGRGFQSPAENPIDLESGKKRDCEPGSELSAIQQRIFNIILQVESTFPRSTEVIDMICTILRTGFSENEPGPFVFPPDDITQYLTQHGAQASQIGALVNTASSFISSLAQQEESPHRSQVYRRILLWVIQLMKELPEPESDPELTHNGIDFVSRLITKSPATLVHLEPFEEAEFFFLFTLKVLEGREPLPKSASAEFWATFMSIKNATPEVQDRSLEMTNAIGPLLAQRLAINIGGHASRSELDKLSEPIKKMISRFPAAKEWLSAGLDEPSFPSSKVTPEQKVIFIKKLVSLRGSRITNQVVRDFWLACRGSNFAYAS